MCSRTAARPARRSRPRRPHPPAGRARQKRARRARCRAPSHRVRSGLLPRSARRGPRAVRAAPRRAALGKPVEAAPSMPAQRETSEGSVVRAPRSARCTRHPARSRGWNQRTPAESSRHPRGDALGDALHDSQQAPEEPPFSRPQRSNRVTRPRPQTDRGAGARSGRPGLRAGNERCRCRRGCRARGARRRAATTACGGTPMPRARTRDQGPLNRRGGRRPLADLAPLARADARGGHLAGPGPSRPSRGPPSGRSDTAGAITSGAG